MKVFLKPSHSITKDVKSSSEQIYTNIFLTVGKWYDAGLTPVMYDPNTLQAVETYYIIACDDGRYRKFNPKHFITQEEWRNEQIKKIID
jgi:hypothetical protein